MKLPFFLLVLLYASAAAEAQVMHPTTPPPAPVLENALDDTETILRRYAAAWDGDMPLERDVVFGFEISGSGGGSYAVTLTPSGLAQVGEGLPSVPAPVFVTDIETLRRIDRDELSAMTAMARARDSDPTPLRVRFPAGFRWTPETQALYLPLTHHFFNRGDPEIIRFGDGVSRPVHGGHSTILYYDHGLRTSWYQLRPGMHINADPADQVNPFPSLFVVTRGKIHSRIGGHERMLQEGEAILVPEGVAHEFWAKAGDYGEFILVMFGEGA